MVLESYAAKNNQLCLKRGLGHWSFRPARRQNVAWSGSDPTQLWVRSPPHNALLLATDITEIGLSHIGSYWTLNAW